MFLPDGSLLSRYQIGMGPDDRLIAYRPADVRQDGPAVDATVYVQGMALVGVG